MVEESSLLLNSISSVKNVSYNFIKRICDILFGIFGCICILPLILIVKLCNVCNKDYNPIFYTQDRIGKNGKIFKLYKFRSMVPDADNILKELLKKKKYRDEYEKYHKLTDDPRITKIGNFLRKTSLDEIPQFINVLKGDMSLIGPRPLVPGELDEHNGDHEIYESVKPGLSGYWASHGRSCADYKKRLELEYYYCNNASLWLDLRIIFRTIYVVIKRDGAK